MGALVTRRRFLVSSLALGAALATAGFTARLAPPASGARVLATHELAIVDALAEVMFPAGPMPIDGREAQVSRWVDQYVADLLDRPRLMAFRYVLRAIEVGTQASRGVRFTELGAADRRDVLEAWSDPRVLPRRVSFDAVRTFLGMAYFRHPAIIAHIGWRAECGGETA